jgi:hypothetical protein
MPYARAFGLGLIVQTNPIYLSMTIQCARAKNQGTGEIY